jgi:hypothetical protein
MSDALLKNTFNKISPAYELVADVTIATATTQVDFSGLNFGKDDDLLFVSDIVNASGSSSRYGLFANGNYTTTNYYIQDIYANGTAYSGSRNNTSSFNYADNGNKSYAITKIKLTNSGYIVYQSSLSINYGGNIIALDDTYCTSTFTSTSITSLRIASAVANAIGIGSRFQLYRLKAKKVADIIVGSATTQVDITGLSIDKDSEYMLVSDVVNSSASNSAYSLFPNDNVTQTNYYQQNLKVDSTTVSGSRVNNNRIAEAIASRKSFSNTNIKITNNSYFITQSNETRDYGLSTILLNKFYDTSTFTLTSITKLSIVSSVTNAIGIGSRFTLYKMK